MSPSTNAHPLPRDGRDRSDAGFSLLEIVVALGILMLVLTALLPQLIVGIKATATANKSTVLKTVVQGELERLRGLPYRVAPDADDDTVEYIDILDLHYPNREAPASTATCTTGGEPSMPEESWEGFLQSGMGCSYEPQSGVFYRTVELKSHEGLGAIGIVIDLQFLSAGTAAAPKGEPLAPRPDYDSLTATHDLPPTSQLGATVTVIYHDRGEYRSQSAYTQIAQRLLSPTRLRSHVDIEALKVSSRRADGAVLTLSAGVVNLNAALSHASTADANVAAATGTLSTGAPATSQAAYGAARTGAAPPATSLAPLSAESTGLADSCLFICWGDTALAPAAADVTSDAARPRVGSSTAPVQGEVTNLENSGVQFDNASDHVYRLGVLSPLVRFDSTSPADVFTTQAAGCTPASGGTSRLTASGFLDASASVTSPATVEACGLAGSSRISILPTAWAPEGVVRVTVSNASARCQVVDGTGMGTASYSAVVEVSDGAGGYQPASSLTAAGGALGDPSTFTLGARGNLDQYIESWSAPGAIVGVSGNPVSVEFVALTIATAPVRTMVDTNDDVVPDPESMVSVAVGAVSCSAMDAR